MEGIINKSAAKYNVLNIKEIISLYLQKDNHAIEEFWNRYSTKVFNFPIKVYRADEDIAGDYFLYVFERLKDGKKFESFDTEQNFDTWFYIVLRNFFFSMMRSKHEVKTVNIATTDKDGNELFTIDSFEDKTQRTYYQSLDENEYIDTIDKLLEGLKNDYSIIIKLQLIYYFDLTPSEIKELANTSGRKNIEILRRIEEIRKELEEKSRNMTMKEMQIGKIYSIKRDLSLKLERLKKDELEGKDVSEEMDEIKRKLAKRKTQFEKMTDEKEKGLYIIRASHKSVAELLGITENAVSIRMHRAEKALREKIEREDLI